MFTWQLGRTITTTYEENQHAALLASHSNYQLERVEEHKPQWSLQQKRPPIIHISETL